MSNALVEHARTPPRVTLRCTTGCRTVSRVYRTEPVVAVGGFRFCPVCGATVMGLSNADDNGWEALAAHYGMSVPAIRAIHATWNPHDFYRFSDYVHAMREEARTGQPQPTRPYLHQSVPQNPYIPTRPLVESAPTPLPKMRVPT